MMTKPFINHLIRIYLAFALLFVGSQSVLGQSDYRPYEFFTYLKLDSLSYRPNSYIHTSFKPYLYADSFFHATRYSKDSIGINRKPWLLRKIFDEHLVDIKREDYSFYLDFLPDFQIGKDFKSNNTTWLNTRGYQIGGSIGKTFSFYTSGFENQGRFVNYYDSYVNARDVIPGQSYNRGYDKDPIPQTKDWSYVTALLSYTPNKYLNVTLGHDKNFIGDGYRSLLLSDFASPYSFLKLTGTLGRVQYTAIWAGMQDPMAVKVGSQIKNRKKGAVFHYLDWNVSKRLSIGFFDAIVWAARDDEGNRLGFNIDYLNPIIFLRPLEASGGSADNAVLGLNGKYEFSSKVVAYGQFVLDEFEAKHFFSNNGSYRNKYGFQLGLRGHALLKKNSFNYLLEYNSVKPYTYSEQNLSIINYAHYNEPLAHPIGANFREMVGLFSYQINRIDISAQANYARYGYDEDEINMGKDIFKLFNVNYKPLGNYVGQGITTDLLFLQGKISYVFNPKTNLRFTVIGGYRMETNDLVRNPSSWLSLGLSSSFRNLYKDF